MNWVDLPTLKAKRFPEQQIEDSEMQRWCRLSMVPARKIGGRWFVDLDAFDAQEAPIKQSVSPTVQLVIDKMRKRG